MFNNPLYKTMQNKNKPKEETALAWFILLGWASVGTVILVNHLTHEEDTEKTIVIPPTVENSDLWAWPEIEQARLTTASWYPGRKSRCSLETSGYLPMGVHGVAHRTLPKGTLLEFRHEGKKVVGIVNDRGPVPDSVEFDLSQPLADSLGILKVGVAEMEVKIVGNI